MTLADMLTRVVADSADRPTWEAARVGKVGGSDAAGYAKPESAPGYAKAKLTSWAGGTVYADRGNFWEPHALAAYGFEQNTLMFHAPDEPRFVATPDGVRESDAGLILAETKATTKVRIQEIDGVVVPAVPPGHFRQMQWEMSVAGPDARVVEYIVVALDAAGSLIRTRPLRRLIPRDNDAIEQLQRIARFVINRLDIAEQYRQENPS